MNGMVWRLFAASVFMFGFGFALVPLYEVFCDITGINGKNYNEGPVATAYSIDYAREVKVQFITSNPGNMPWQFAPHETTQRVNPGRTINTHFTATNPTTEWMVAQAVPSITPSEAAPYLTKINCFCFDRQPLDGGATVDMPMVYVVSPDLPKHISTITVSYSLYDITEVL
jgi:cytochrome c oxidase assembly protein subunit 11